MIPDCPPTRSPVATASIKTYPGDFVVDEISPFEPTGEGEFLLVQIRKRNRNTHEIADTLAATAKKPSKDVSFAGRKDRNAVTTQWFSIHLPGQPDPDLSSFESEDVQILDTVRHHRKLRTGALSGNRFEIRLRDVAGSSGDIESALERVAMRGVPNYFGPQRFGNAGRNLFLASKLGAGGKMSRGGRSMALSAARAAIFNESLAERVKAGNWDEPQDGEIYMFGDGTKCFGPLPVDDVLRARYRETMEVDLTGLLWGKGEAPTSDFVHDLEMACANRHPLWCKVLEKFGLRQERRRLRLRAADFNYTLDGDQLKVSFFLERGAFATTFLGEVFDLQTPENPARSLASTESRAVGR